MQKLYVLAARCAATISLAAQGGVDRTLSHKPLGESWPVYGGDYSGKRYSSLNQINQTNVRTLSLAWTRRVANGPGQAGGAQPGQPGYVPVITGGEGDITFGGATQIKGSILEVDGIL